MRTSVHARLSGASAEAILIATLVTITAAVAGITVMPGRAASVYTAPDGTRIEIDSAGPWTPEQIHTMLVENGLDARIGATLTVHVQDERASSGSVSARREGGHYVGAESVIYLQGIDSSFAISPDAVLAHEFGHVWTLYHLYLTQQGKWDQWTEFRGLAGDPRLDSSYAWSASEMIAEDYRLVLGSASAVAQKPWHINPDIPHPTTVSGLAAFFRTVWAGGSSGPAPTASPALKTSASPLPTPAATPVATAAPTAASTSTPSTTPNATSAPSPVATAVPRTPSPTPSPSVVVKETLVQGVVVNPTPVRRSGDVGFSVTSAVHVRVQISNANGVVVRHLADATFDPGTWTMTWDRTNDRGQRVSKGTYLVEVVAGDASAVDSDVLSVPVR